MRRYISNGFDAEINYLYAIKDILQQISLLFMQKLLGYYKPSFVNGKQNAAKKKIM